MWPIYHAIRCFKLTKCQIDSHRSALCELITIKMKYECEQLVYLKAATMGIATRSRTSPPRIMRSGEPPRPPPPPKGFFPPEEGR